MWRSVLAALLVASAAAGGGSTVRLEGGLVNSAAKGAEAASVEAIPAAAAQGHEEMEDEHSVHHAQTLAMARGNSIFLRHMIGNALKHAPPLTLFRGLSTIRSGAHRNTLDLKIAGVVPVVDLARIYALRGGVEAANTRERIVAARDLGVISRTGAHDLLDAYDLIAETRLRHQAALIARGAAPDNYLAPEALSDLERSHLRDAFLVVKTMQSALGQGG